MARKLWSPELGGILPNWLTDEQKERCYCDDRGWVLVHPDGSEEVIVAGNRYNDPAERGHGFDPVTGKSLDPDRDLAHGINPEVYSLSAPASVSEGNSLTISLSTQYVSAGTSIPYTITGIQQEDLFSGALTGNFVVGTTDSIILGISSDRSFLEGNETLTLTLDGLGEYVDVVINDTSARSNN